MIRCGCGYNLMKLSKYCINNGIAGYEGFIGLPGTVAGAAINNAGSYGSVISYVVKKVEIFTTECETKWITNDQMGYKHRNSYLKTGDLKGIVLSVEFDTSIKEDKSILLEKANKFAHHRKTYQEKKYTNL